VTQEGVQVCYGTEIITTVNEVQYYSSQVQRHFPKFGHLFQCEVWQHFLTCTDEKRWKTGKRKAEKDPLLGGSLFVAIQRPEKTLDAANV